jgi:CubicO group peptidase (beta-lactamase class C family)
MAITWANGIEQLLEQAAADATVPGAAVAVTDASGSTELATAGRLRIDEETPVSAETMFRLMSMTKALGSVAALQLVEQGRLELDQTVASVLPAFGELKVLDGFDGDQPRLREPRQQATIRHLLSHTAGHGYGFLNADILRYHEVTGHPDPFSGLRASLQVPLVADPGTEWNYGINTDWLGQVVEAVSGQDLAAYLEEHLFGPLGMTDTTFAPTAEQRGRLMSIHQRTEDGGLALSEIEAPVAEPEFWPSGHGAYGTARDYARFMAAVLAGGELDGARILAPETIEMAFSDQLGAIKIQEVLHSTLPPISNDIVSAPFAQSWGLGFHLFNEDVPGMRRAGSGDWAGLFNCYFWIDRASGVAAAYLTQVLPFFDGQILANLQAVEASIYAGVTAVGG